MRVMARLRTPSRVVEKQLDFEPPSRLIDGMHRNARERARGAVGQLEARRLSGVDGSGFRNRSGRRWL